MSTDCGAHGWLPCHAVSPDSFLSAFPFSGLLILARSPGSGQEPRPEN